MINGSNFFDGLNTLNVGYFLIISLCIFYLNLNDEINLYNFPLKYLLISLSVIYILNLFNKIFLGDSGSYLLGLFFSIFLIFIYRWNSHISPFFIILLLWYPSFENLFSILRKNILNKSPMRPDSNHLHQLIFYFIKKKMNIRNTFNANIISANLINLYNFMILLLSINFISNSQIQIFLIIFNIIIYFFIYLKLFLLRYKKIMKKKIALIFGVTGQDGSYLAEFLLSKGYLVHGVKEDLHLLTLVELIIFIKIDLKKKVLHYGDVTDAISVSSLIKKLNQARYTILQPNLMFQFHLKYQNTQQMLMPLDR